jgi:16S rRNA (cytidine1402-2'-O)-methyltransferase
MANKPHLWLVPTPVGNLGDLTFRAVEVIKQASAVACEDTRRTGALLMHLGISLPLIRLDAHTMSRALQVLQQYPRLVYMTDAGTPGISDPGAELVREAIAADIAVEVLPGATAFVPALVLSGLKIARFTFEGFLPRAGRERKERLKAISQRPETTVLYESAYRLSATLRELALLCSSDRQASVTRELSKKFEETVRGSLAELAVRFAENVRGEIVIVLAGSTQPVPEEIHDFQALAFELAKQGNTAKDISQSLYAKGLRKKDAYKLALQVTKVD